MDHAHASVPASTFADVCALCAALPGVVVGTSYGTPALKVGDRTFARLHEDGATLVLKVPFVVRDHLLASDPACYHVTEHYRGYPAVLVRLPAVSADALAPLLEEAWRQVAPKRLLRAHAGDTSSDRSSDRSRPAGAIGRRRGR